MTLPEAARVATAPSSGLKTRQVGVPALGQARALQASSQAAARAASAALHAAKRSLHAACAAAPRSPAAS